MTIVADDSENGLILNLSLQMVENIGFSTVSKFYAKAEPGSTDGPVSKMLRCLMVHSMPKHAIQSMLQVRVSILISLHRAR